MLLIRRVRNSPLKMLEIKSGDESTISKQHLPTFNLLVLSMENETFETFWEDVVTYAKEEGVSTDYIESEFILEGELFKVPLKFKDEFLNSDNSSQTNGTKEQGGVS